jgi:hypothetical protein
MIWLLTGLLVVALIFTSLRASVWLLSRGSYNSARRRIVAGPANSQAVAILQTAGSPAVVGDGRSSRGNHLC